MTILVFPLSLTPHILLGLLLIKNKAAQPTQAVTVPKITRYLRKDATWQLYRTLDNFARIFNPHHTQYCHNARSDRQNIKKSLKISLNAQAKPKEMN
jgi:hypothetical protein